MAFGLVRTLRRLLQEQRADAEAQARRGQRVSLAHWRGPMAEALLPALLPFFERGGRQTMNRLALAAADRTGGKAYAHRSGKAWAVTKALAAGLSLGWDVFNPRVYDALRELVLDLCAATLETSALEANRAVEETRRNLTEGLGAGETSKDLAERLGDIFAPERAQTIAATEASRALHGGQVLAAKESGIVKGKVWLASADACKKCLALNGKEVGLDEAFAVERGGGPYSVILHPPYHPRCFCGMTESILYSALGLL